jgi:glucokinase
MNAFTKKGRFQDVIQRIPTNVITARAALIGAASYGPENLKKQQQVINE